MMWSALSGTSMAMSTSLLPRVRWKVLLATTAFVVAFLVLCLSIVDRLSVTAPLDVGGNGDGIAEAGNGVGGSAEPPAATATATATATGTATATAAQAVDWVSAVKQVAGQVVDAGRAAVDAVVDAGNAAGVTTLLDQLGLANADVPFVPMVWERPQAVWHVENGAADPNGPLAFEVHGAPIPMPVEISLDTGVQTGTLLNVTGRIGGNVVLAAMSTGGAMMFVLSFQPGVESYVTYPAAKDWIRSPLPYPAAFQNDSVPVVILVRVAEAHYDIAVDSTWIARVPISPFSQHEQCGLLLVRAYEDMPHTVAVTSVTGTGLPRTRRSAAASFTPSERARHQPPLNATTNAEVFVGVMSSASNYAARDGVRNAWFLDPSVLQGRVAVRFFVGHSHDTEVAARLNEEHRRYGDIVQISAPEAYLNVGYKTLAMVDTLITKTNARYLLKCDDDTFLRLDRILQNLAQDGQPPVYMGYISPSGETNRNPTDRYFISRAVFQSRTVPRFAHGPAYIISRDLAGYILAAIHRGHLHVLPLEDVAMASWVDHAREVGQMAVRYVSSGRFRIFTCDKNAFNGHYITPGKMKCMWERVEASAGDWCC